MWDIFSTAANAVLPILLLILIGNLLRNRGFLSEEFVKVGNKFVFRIGLTCSLFINVYNITDLSSISWLFIIYVIAITIVMFAIGLVSSILVTKERTRRGVILQAVFRSNFAIIGLSLATSVGGEPAAAIASLISAFILPIYNILGVIALSLFVKDQNNGKNHIKSVLISILKNPMVMGAALGLFCILVRELQTLIFGHTVFTIKESLPFAFKAVENIKVMTTPLALIVLGAQFKFSAVKGMFKEISVGTLWRIVLAPTIGVCGAVLLDHLQIMSCSGGEYATLLALFGAPAAVSSAVMAGEMGSDEQLATQLVVWSSVGSVITIFVGVCILMAYGLIVI